MSLLLNHRREHMIQNAINYFELFQNLFCLKKAWGRILKGLAGKIKRAA